MDLRKWWAASSREIYWLEITDRRDLGSDLNAPQTMGDGKQYWGYSLLNLAEDGDIVFHYSKPQSAIVAVSAVSGDVWADEVVWAAHGTSARSLGVQPYTRPGWRRGLDQFTPLPKAVSLEMLRRREGDLARVAESLASNTPRYLPFEFSRKRPLRPTQAYLAKLPRGMVDLFPELKGPADGVSSSHDANDLGIFNVASASRDEYRWADERSSVARRDPFSVDPVQVERALKSHACSQNLLARLLLERGLTPRSPSIGEPNFDLAWDVGQKTYVAEIKSITARNEENQLRLGLGQVLRYRHVLGTGGREVTAVLCVERKPTDSNWTALCRSLGIDLIWPRVLQRFVREHLKAGDQASG